MVFPLLQAETQDICTVTSLKSLGEEGCNLDVTRVIYLHHGFRSQGDIQLEDNLCPVYVICLRIVIDPVCQDFFPHH